MDDSKNYEADCLCADGHSADLVNPGSAGCQWAAITLPQNGFAGGSCPPDTDGEKKVLNVAGILKTEN
jgi:hypothetical protein